MSIQTLQQPPAAFWFFVLQRLSSGRRRHHGVPAGRSFAPRLGQAITDSGPRGERCTTRPYTPQNVLATLFHVLGIDPETTTLPNPAGPPRYLLEDTRRIDELV